MSHSDSELLTIDLFRKYQHFTTDLIVDQLFSPTDPMHGLILAYDLGSGKTISSLTGVRRLLDRFDIRRVLVVANLLVAKTVWPIEIESWKHTAPLSYTLIRVEDDDPHVEKYAQQAYDEAYREAKAEFDAEVKKLVDIWGIARGEAKIRVGQNLPTPSKVAGAARTKKRGEVKEAKLAHLAAQDTEIHIINKQALPWLWDHFERGRKWPYDLMIVDDVREARSGKKYVKVGKDVERPKGAPAQLSRFGVMAAARKRMKATIELCGTPTPNGLEAMWGLAYIVDQGRRLGTARTAFEQRWFDKNEYSRSMKAKPHAMGEIMDLVKDIMFSLDPKDLAELPEHMMPPHYPPIYVDLPDDIMAEYHRFAKTMVSEVYDVEAVNKGVLTNKLLQFANGSMYREGGQDVAIHDLKMGALENLVDELNGNPVLIAYNFRFDLARLRKRYPNFIVMNEADDALKLVKMWSDGLVPGILAHRESAGHGLNLQHGGHHMIQYGLTSDLELYQQFNKRLHRPGQKHTVWNHHILARGTYDERVIPILTRKEAVQEDVLRSTRAEISAYG